MPGVPTMIRFRLVLVVILLLGALGGTTAAYADPSRATLVYDVKLKEFTCWREGELTATARSTPCEGEGWHPVTSDLYFTRGEALSILLVHASVLDIFAIEVQAEDLAEPALAVRSAMGDIPKLVPLITAPTIIPGTNVTLSGAPPSIKASQLYRLLSTATSDDFTAWIQNQIIKPSAADDLKTLFALDPENALIALANLHPIVQDVTKLSEETDSVVVPSDSALKVINTARALVKVIDRAVALKNQIAALGIPVAGKTVADATKLLQSPALRQALEVDTGDLATFASEFELAFAPAVRYRRIAALTLSGGHLGLPSGYIDAGDPQTDMEEFLGRVESDAGGTLSAQQLDQLKKNLTVLATQWSDLSMARSRLETVAGIAGKIKDHRNSADSVFALQNALNDFEGKVILKASDLNAAAQSLPLDDALTVLNVGQWFASKTVTITMKQGQRYALFDLAGTAQTASTSAVSPASESQSKPAQTSPSAIAAVRSVTIPIYNLYRVQLGLGAAYSNADDRKFQVSTATSGSGASATTEKFVEETISRNYNALWTANLIVFPSARHAFPWRPRFNGERKPRQLTNLGVALGFSMTDPSRNFLVGGAWFPERGTVGIQVAWHIAMRDVPAADVDDASALTDRVTVLQRKRYNGLAIGIVVAPDFFAKLITPIFKQP
jgi:hypothetical protein